MFRSARRQKLADDVAEQIARRILSGRLGDGQRLPSERELMSLFGVGRTTVREALQALQFRGLITISHGRRASVGTGGGTVPRSFADDALATIRDAATIDDLKDFRALVEVKLAARAAQRASPDDIRELEAALLANRRAIATRRGYLKTDIAFHKKIAAIAGNRLLERLVGQLLESLARQRLDLLHVRGANLLSHDEHAAIARAIADGDPAAAADAMERHLLRSNALYAVLHARSESGAEAPKKPVTARLPRRRRVCGGKQRRRSQP